METIFNSPLLKWTLGEVKDRIQKLKIEKQKKQKELDMIIKKRIDNIVVKKNNKNESRKFFNRKEAIIFYENKLELLELEEKRRNEKFQRIIDDYYISRKNRWIEMFDKYISFDLPQYWIINISKNIEEPNLFLNISSEVLTIDEWNMLIAVHWYKKLKELLSISLEQVWIDWKVFWTSTKNKWLKLNLEWYYYVVNIDYEEFYSLKNSRSAWIIYKYND